MNTSLETPVEKIIASLTQEKRDELAEKIIDFMLADPEMENVLREFIKHSLIKSIVVLDRLGESIVLPRQHL